ncbi:MAG: 50S ribosomal protein L11 methyltransferase [Chitinophagaceae bacterium]
MNNYISIRFEGVPKEQQEILIAQLSELNFEGFEEGPRYLTAFIPESLLQEEALQQLVEQGSYTTSRETIAQKNWNEEWEKNFSPVIINNFCAIRAHFHEPVTDVPYEIVITPKMSFGTGHHPTTALMVEYMQQTTFTDETVLDFGTGTGVLAILAEKLGAVAVTAIDNDDWSIENAQENVQINQCKKIAVYKADTLQMIDKYDIILANINKHVLLANMHTIQQHLAPGGVILMSGLLAGDRKDIEECAMKEGLRLVDLKQMEGWIALNLTHIL